MSFSVRRCTSDADKARSLEIYNTTWPDEAVTPKESAAWEAAQTDSESFLAGEVGSAVVGLHPSHSEIAFTLVTVLPEARRQGAGTALYAAVSTWTRDRGVHELETRAAAVDAASIGFATRRGFYEHSREGGLELDLRRAEPPSYTPPPGIELTSLALHPELAPRVYDVDSEASPDVPGYEHMAVRPLAEWLEHNVARAGVPPEAFVLALAGDDVVGFAKLRIDPGGRTATHYMTGVKRAWRGRGIARAMKSRQIAWAKEQGLERLRTQNELRNAAMLRVNERLGYRPAAGRVTLRGPLAGSVLNARRDA